MNIFNSIGTVINSITGFITSTARVMEKTVLVVEQEVDNMFEESEITVKQISIKAS